MFLDRGLFWGLVCSLVTFLVVIELYVEFCFEVAHRVWKVVWKLVFLTRDGFVSVFWSSEVSLHFRLHFLATHWGRQDRHGPHRWLLWHWSLVLDLDLANWFHASSAKWCLICNSLMILLKDLEVSVILWSKSLVFYFDLELFIVDILVNEVVAIFVPKFPIL